MQDVTKADVGAALRRLRGAQGLTLTELAEESGVALSTLCRWERGGRAMSAVNLARVLAALGATWDQYGRMLERVRAD